MLDFDAGEPLRRAIRSARAGPGSTFNLVLWTGVQPVRSRVEIEGEGFYPVFTTVREKDRVKALTGGRQASVLAEKPPDGQVI